MHPALLSGFRKQGLPQGREAQIIGPGMESGCWWQILQHLAVPGKYSLYSLGTLAEQQQRLWIGRATTLSGLVHIK